MSELKKRPALVEHLLTLAQQEQRGRLAALRRGLGHPPGTISSTFRDVAPFVPNSVLNGPHELDHYIVATLFAMHPHHTDQGGFGDTVRRVAEARGGKPGESPSADARFNALLTAGRGQLPEYLRRVVTMARGCVPPVSINYAQLLKDLKHWDHPNQSVQRRWARQYWTASRADSPQYEGEAS